MRCLLLLLFATTSVAGDFATALGTAYQYNIAAIATDSAGNTYVTGSRILPSSSDVFVVKLDPNGNLLFTDTFGGTVSQQAAAIAVDSSGNIYVAGATASPDFPVSKALQSQPGAPGSGFLVKLTNGGTVLYSTYFGGTLGQSAITSIATDAKGNLYVTGWTNATDYPQTSGLPQVQNGGTMVAEISAAGDRIVYSGAIDSGGSQVYIAADAAGNAYVAGLDTGNQLVTTPGAFLSTSSGRGAYAAKINAGGTGFGYLTYLAAGGILITSVAADASGDLYLGGGTVNAAFPTTPGALQPNYGSPQGGSTVGFLAKLNPTGSAMLWATYLGGGAGNEVQSIAVDASGTVWATGSAQASTFPNANGWTTGPEYVTGVGSNGTTLVYSALYPFGSIGLSVAVDAAGIVHMAGLNGFVSTVNPSAPPAIKILGFQNGFGSSLTARIAPAEVIAIYGPGIGPTAPVAATPVNGFYSTTLGGVQVSINGTNIPLLYVSANQINAVALMNLPSGASATVRVTNGTASSAGFPVWIDASEPLAYPTVFNQDWTINSLKNPAHGASIVTFYVTGWQPNFSPLADGQVANAAIDVCRGHCIASAASESTVLCTGFCDLARPAVLPGTVTLPASVLYAGEAPGMVAGVTQFNVQLGSPAANAALTLFQLDVGGAPSTSNPGLGVQVSIAP